MQQRRDANDRRKIERISNPMLRDHLLQIDRLLRFLFLIFSAACIYVVARGALGSVSDFTRGFFLGIVFGGFSFLLFRYGKAIKFYRENESSSNLDRVMEQQSLLLMAVALFVVLAVISYFVAGYF